MSKKHSSRNKELDIQVVSLLQSSGIFNQVRANTFANLATEVQSSNLESMKCYKNIKTDDDYELASEIVFEYLQKHNMEKTINCIKTETENKLRPVPISNNIQNDLNIPQKENVLHHVVQYYNNNMTEIFTKYHESLINDVNKRIQDIGKSKPKPTERKSPKATTAPISQSNSKSSVTQIPNSKTQNPAKKEESSSIEFDLGDDDIPTPTKTPTKPPAAQNTSAQKVKSESSDLVFDDTSDFDKPAAKKPAAKPASSTQPAQSVKKVSDSEFSDFDDDLDLEDNTAPSPKQTKPASKPKPKNDDDFDDDFDLDDDAVSVPKQNKSPNQSKPKNEMDDFFDDDQEPPLMNNPAKSPPKNDDFDDDSLQDDISDL